MLGVFGCFNVWWRSSFSLSQELLYNCCWRFSWRYSSHRHYSNYQKQVCWSAMSLKWFKSLEVNVQNQRCITLKKRIFAQQIDQLLIRKQVLWEAKEDAWNEPLSISIPIELSEKMDLVQTYHQPLRFDMRVISEGNLAFESNNVEYRWIWVTYV